ncbi:MAG: endonuclease domain-containing protein [Gammaproteobacteria bacterium]|nr:endonuclease domain-containing protein [Gammaproteobacteria bacterium]
MQSLLQQRARQLRKKMPEAEKKLWHRLRRRQLRGLRFRRQVAFDKYIVDFACFEPKIIIEVDGSQHAIQVAYDDQRTKFLRSFGYTVLRFWNNEILGDIENVLQTIWNVCTPPSALRAPSPVGKAS